MKSKNKHEPVIVEDVVQISPYRTIAITSTMTADQKVTLKALSTFFL